LFLQVGTGFTALGSFGRLYGAPSHLRGQGQQSLAPPLTLSLDRLSIPSEMWDWIEALNALFNSVFSDATAATAFLAKDPTLVRDTLLGSEGNFYESFECKMIGAALDPAVKAIAASGDFDALIQQLGSMELIHVADRSILADRLDDVLISKQQALATLPDSGIDAVLSGADGTAAGAAALVVGVNVAAIINIGALVNFAVFIAVYAWTQGPSPRVNGVFPNTEHTNGGRILKLDPNLFSNYESAVQIARLTGNYALVEKSFEHLLGVEADAITASIDRVFLTPRNMSNDVERDKVYGVIHDSLRRLYRA
jgi:hypothetical protein